MEQRVALVVALLAVGCAVAVLARRVAVPYPVLLVVVGLLLALVPGLPAVRLDPDIAFLVFLPPLLFIPAVSTSWRDFKANLRPISLLAVGLVLATTALVAVVAHAVVLGLPWPAAFVLGAIVAPPDAVAATTIARRLGLPQRIVTIIEGESLVNDAASLVAYRVAVAAVVTGSFSLGSASLSFVVGGVGGVAIGVGFGFLRGLAARVLSPDAAVDNTLFLLTPYAAYLVAEQVEVSGVLAVVAAGLVVARVSSPVVGFQTRLSSLAITDLLSFVLTSLVFVLIGLQLRPVLAALPQDRLLPVLGETLLVALTVVVVRMLWVFPGMYLPRLLSAREQRPPIGGALVVGWAGMRGVVSLAAALSLPTATDSGGAFPNATCSCSSPSASSSSPWCCRA